MNEATLQYVRQHADQDVRMLALRGSKDDAVDMTAALQQIAGRQTARKKLPSWAALDSILYPPHLNMEQCSSEQTARYKASVCSGSVCSDSVCSGSVYCDSVAMNNGTLIDLTGGLGVDFSFLAPLFDQAIYVEQQEELCRLAQHNFPLLGINNSTVVCANGEDYLHQLEHASLIFMDPARRDEHGARTYGISDCTPNVLTLRDELLQKADYVMLKLSPMLDWRKTVSDLGRECVREVHIVATGGECKELLVVLSKTQNTLRVVCVNDEEVFIIEDADTSVIPAFGTPVAGCFLYEPNAAVMKAGCFKALAEKFGVVPIAQNSHLFVSDKLIDNFPGRKFRVDAVSTMNKKELKEMILPLYQANITVRNFPLSVPDLRKRLKLNEGGSHYIFATTLANGVHVLAVCQRM